MDSVTLEDWGEEIFAEGVGVKWRKWARGEGDGTKKYALFFPPTSASMPPLHQPSTGCNPRWRHRTDLSSVPYSAPKIGYAKVEVAYEHVAC